MLCPFVSEHAWDLDLAVARGVGWLGMLVQLCMRRALTRQVGSGYGSCPRAGKDVQGDIFKIGIISLSFEPARNHVHARD